MATYLAARSGDTNVYTGTVTSSGSAVDLTGATLRFIAKAEISDADGDAIINKYSPSNGVEIVSAAAGTWRLTISPADTASLGEVVLHYELQVTTSGSAVYTAASGTLTVSPDVVVTTP